MKENRLKMKLREIRVMRMGWIWLVEISVRSNFVNRFAFTGTCLLRTQ